MTTPFTILPNYNYEDYQSWRVKNWELIDGIPFALQSVYDLRHQSALEKIFHLFSKALEGKELEIGRQAEVLVNRHTLLRPDITVTNKKPGKGVCLLAEIINEKGIVIEKLVKPQLYAAKGIPWYIIFDITENLAEVHELVEGKYQMMQQGKDISFIFELDEYRAEIAFREIW